MAFEKYWLVWYTTTLIRFFKVHCIPIVTLYSYLSILVFRNVLSYKGALFHEDRNSFVDFAAFSDFGICTCNENLKCLEPTVFYAYVFVTGLLALPQICITKWGTKSLITSKFCQGKK